MGLAAATYQLSIKDVFECLSHDEKMYAHHLSQAAWHGGRIILRQTSPEGTGIFDFILELHKGCQGKWEHFIQHLEVSVEELNAFLDFAGMFLAKLNNFCVCFCQNLDEITIRILIAMIGRGRQKSRA
jgi:dipeptidyl-peptidase III